MIPLAIVVILLVIVFTVALVLAPDPATLSIFGARIDTNTTGVYFTGAVTMLVLLLALMLLRAGISRSVRRRREVRSLKKQAELGTTEESATPTDDGRKGKSGKAQKKAGKAQTGRTQTGRTQTGRTQNEKVLKEKAPKEKASESSSTKAGDSAQKSGGASSTSRTPAHESAQPPEGQTTTASERQALLDETEAVLGDDTER